MLTITVKFTGHCLTSDDQVLFVYMHKATRGVPILNAAKQIPLTVKDKRCIVLHKVFTSHMSLTVYILYQSSSYSRID